MSKYDPAKYNPQARRESYLRRREACLAYREEYYDRNRESEIAANFARYHRKRKTAKRTRRNISKD